MRLANEFRIILLFYLHGIGNWGRLYSTHYRRSWFSIFRRVDWFDGDKDRIKIDIQLTSFFRFVVNTGITWASFSTIRSNKQDHR